MLPRGFLLSLARSHGGTLRRFLVNMTQLTLEDVQCVCELFPLLEELSCAVASHDAVRTLFPLWPSIGKLISFRYPPRSR